MRNPYFVTSKPNLVTFTPSYLVTPQNPILQVRQFEGMLSPLLAPPLPALPNATMAWAALAVEELTRLGVSTFAVAPGTFIHIHSLRSHCHCDLRCFLCVAVAHRLRLTTLVLLPTTK